MLLDINKILGSEKLSVLTGKNIKRKRKKKPKVNRKMKTFQKITLMLVLVVMNLSLCAQNHAKENTNKEKHKHTQKHHLSVFNGITSNFTHHSNDYTIGMDYEYRITQWVGLGLIGEYINTTEGEWVAGIPVFIHFAKELKLNGSPLLINKAEHTENHSTHSEPKRKTELAFRTGLSYSLHLKKLAIGPVVSFDIGESKSLVYGINIAIGF